MRTLRFIVLGLSVITACGKQATTTTKQNTSPPTPAVVTITGLKSPESVLYDAEQDAYFISNINGGELAMDDNGFIARVDAGTLAVDLQWIAAGRNGVTLHCPKGMGIAGDTLYVSDADGVRMFDRRGGVPKGIVPLPGAVFINDIATDGDTVYVSDTGLAMGPGTTFKPAGTDAIWMIRNGQARRIASGDALLHPNGLAVVGGRLWVATFGGHELYRLDDGKKAGEIELPHGQLDGIVHLADGSFVVSSWDGNAVYRGKSGEPFAPVVQSTDAPADIGYDTKRHRLLVPAGNEVTIHPLG